MIKKHLKFISFIFAVIFLMRCMVVEIAMVQASTGFADNGGAEVTEESRETDNLSRSLTGEEWEKTEGAEKGKRTKETEEIEVEKTEKEIKGAEEAGRIEEAGKETKETKEIELEKTEKEIKGAEEGGRIEETESETEKKEEIKEGIKETEEGERTEGIKKDAVEKAGEEEWKGIQETGKEMEEVTEETVKDVESELEESLQEETIETAEETEELEAILKVTEDILKMCDALLEWHQEINAVRQSEDGYLYALNLRQEFLNRMEQILEKADILAEESYDEYAKVESYYNYAELYRLYCLMGKDRMQYGTGSNYYLFQRGLVNGINWSCDNPDSSVGNTLYCHVRSMSAGNGSERYANFTASKPINLADYESAVIEVESYSADNINDSYGCFNLGSYSIGFRAAGLYTLDLSNAVGYATPVVRGERTGSHTYNTYFSIPNIYLVPNQEAAVTVQDRVGSAGGMLLGTSTAMARIGHTYAGSAKGASAAVGAYYTGYYYTGCTTAAVTASGTVVYRYFTPASYTVICKDYQTNTSGRLLGTSSWSAAYNTMVSGASKGASIVEGTYYTGYKYTGCTTAAVGTGGATVYRYFAPISYTVNYNGNGATGGTTASSSHTYHAAKNLTSNGYARTGYTFQGWSENPAAIMPVYKNSQSVKNLRSTSGTITLYAVWKANVYNIIYDGNGATEGVMEKSSHRYDESSALFENTYQRVGYTFLGWAKTPQNDKHVGQMEQEIQGGGEQKERDLQGEDKQREQQKGEEPQEEEESQEEIEYADKELVLNLTAEEGAAVTLYAVWKANTYHIVYDGNGATEGVMENSSHRYDEISALSENMYQRTGYTFLGWKSMLQEDGYQGQDEHTKQEQGKQEEEQEQGGDKQEEQDKDNTNRDNADKDNTNKDNAEQDREEIYTDKEPVLNLVTKEDAAVTLYAVWKANTYKIVYDGNGATGGVTTASIHAYDEIKTLTKNAYIKTGYIFRGWMKEPGERKLWENMLPKEESEEETSKAGAFLKRELLTADYQDRQAVLNLTAKEGDRVKLYALWEKIYHPENNQEADKGSNHPNQDGNDEQNNGNSNTNSDANNSKIENGNDTENTNHNADGDNSNHNIAIDNTGHNTASNTNYNTAGNSTSHNIVGGGTDNNIPAITVQEITNGTASSDTFENQKKVQQSKNNPNKESDKHSVKESDKHSVKESDKHSIEESDKHVTYRETENISDNQLEESGSVSLPGYQQKRAGANVFHTKEQRRQKNAAAILGCILAAASICVLFFFFILRNRVILYGENAKGKKKLLKIYFLKKTTESLHVFLTDSFVQENGTSHFLLVIYGASFLKNKKAEISVHWHDKIYTTQIKKHISFMVER